MQALIYCHIIKTTNQKSSNGGTLFHKYAHGCICVAYKSFKNEIYSQNNPNLGLKVLSLYHMWKTLAWPSWNHHINWPKFGQSWYPQKGNVI
jgi:hypothetical protein